MAPLGDEPSDRRDYFPIDTVPRSLDIVWCRFPETGMPSAPGPKARPALVNSVAVAESRGIAKIKISYGTSNLKEDRRPFDLIVSDPGEMGEAGLPRPTRFDLDETIWLPWCAEFFGARPGFRTPIIGRLPPSAIARLKDLIAIRRAEAGRPKR